LDAQLLAHHSITGMWKASFIPSEQCQELRVLWAARGEAKRAATRHSNRINNIILRFGHTVGAEHSIRSSEAEGIIDDLVEGRKPICETVAPDGLPESVRPIIRELYQRMTDAIVEARTAQKCAKGFITASEWPTAAAAIRGDELLRILQTVPGIGETSAITWLCEIGDPRRFEHAKQVAAFSGCDPSLKVSAGKVTSHVRRAGNARLHSALGYAAQAVMQKPDSPLAQWGRSIAGRHKKGGYRKACGAVTRRLACSLWHVHRLGVEYSDAQYTFAQDLLVAEGAISDIVGKRYVSLLASESIKSTQDLARAYTRGELARIRGFGEKAINLVKEWVLKQSRPVKAPRVYTLDRVTRTA
jgi:transposase